MTYKICANFTDYFNIDIDINDIYDELSDAIGDDEAINFVKNNTKLSTVWPEISGKFVDVGLNNLERPDITLFNNVHLILNTLALNKLKNQLEKVGELLPITIDHEAHYLFNCLNPVDADEAKSEADFVEGIWMGIKSIDFLPSTSATNLVFKTQFDRCKALYCGDKFKELCEDHNLKGLTFSENLTEQF